MYDKTSKYENSTTNIVNERESALKCTTKEATMFENALQRKRTKEGDSAEIVPMVACYDGRREVLAPHTNTLLSQV